MKNKYYRVTNLSLSPYMENAVYSGYEFSNDPLFEHYTDLKYIEITKEEFNRDWPKTIEREEYIIKAYYKKRGEYIDKKI